MVVVGKWGRREVGVEAGRGGGNGGKKDKRTAFICYFRIEHKIYFEAAVD